MAQTAADILWQTAQSLAGAGPLPPLLFITDPERTPDPEALMQRLPRGAGVIYRGFGRPEALEEATRLAAVARAGGLVLLIGQDPDLAEKVGADGVHLPERLLGAGPGLRARFPHWILTGAAHGEAALEAAAEAGLDAAILSPVFPSNSPSAGEALGLGAFSALARAARLPVYALGGIKAAAAPALIGSGAYGLAAIEGVLEAWS